MQSTGYHMLSAVVLSSLLSVFCVISISDAKYLLTDQRVLGNELQECCQNTYGTDPASIHSNSDMVEAQSLCRSHNSGDCFIGLIRNTSDTIYDTFYWLDGTPWDFGNIHSSEWSEGYYPWCYTASGPNPNGGAGIDDCAMLEDANDYLWSDTTCPSLLYGLCNVYSTTETSISPSLTHEHSVTSDPTSTTQYDDRDALPSNSSYTISVIVNSCDRDDDECIIEAEKINNMLTACFTDIIDNSVTVNIDIVVEGGSVSNTEAVDNEEVTQQSNKNMYTICFVVGGIVLILVIAASFIYLLCKYCSKMKEDKNQINAIGKYVKSDIEHNAVSDGGSDIIEHNEEQHNTKGNNVNIGEDEFIVKGDDEIADGVTTKGETNF